MENLKRGSLYDIFPQQPINRTPEVVVTPEITYSQETPVPTGPGYGWKGFLTAVMVLGVVLLVVYVFRNNKWVVEVIGKR